MTAAPDRFRGTVQRWTVDTGPQAGTCFDWAFNADWSIAWRVVAGEQQGRVGRSREFSQQAVRPHQFMVAFRIDDEETVSATVDFGSKRFVGYVIGPGGPTPIAGSLQVL